MGDVIRFCKGCQEFRPHTTSGSGIRGACQQCGQEFGPTTHGQVPDVAVLEDEAKLLQEAAAEAATRLRIAQARDKSKQNGEGRFEAATRELAARLDVACPERVEVPKFIEAYVGQPQTCTGGRIYRGEALDDQDIAEKGGAR